VERDDLLHLLKELAEGFLQGELKADLFVRTMDGLISSNLDTVPDFEEFHLRLGDYGVRGVEPAVTLADLESMAKLIIEKSTNEN
jgi:hypothetical protein